MDPQTLWIVALTISTPIAGVVGFAIQLRAISKSRLENEKLQLEIEALKAKALAAERRIIQVTTAEVQRFTARDNVMFSRAPSRSHEEVGPTPVQKTSRKELTIVGAVVLSLLLLAGYLLYDIYRLVAWLITKL